MSEVSGATEIFSLEEIRIMLGKNIGHKYLMPLAMDYLEKDPFVSSGMCSGDLLCNVLSVELYWEFNPEMHQRLVNVLKKIETPEKYLPEECFPLFYEVIESLTQLPESQ